MRTEPREHSAQAASPNWNSSTFLVPPQISSPHDGEAQCSTSYRLPNVKSDKAKRGNSQTLRTCKMNCIK